MVNLMDGEKNVFLLKSSENELAKQPPIHMSPEGRML